MIDISGLRREEKLDLLERLWDSLTAPREDVPVWDWQHELLVRRFDELEREGPTGITPEELFESLGGQHE